MRCEKRHAQNCQGKALQQCEVKNFQWRRTLKDKGEVKGRTKAGVAVSAQWVGG